MGSGVEAGTLYQKVDTIGANERIGIGIPRHVLIIPDNNRTWAKTNGKTIREGYQVGARRMFEVANEASRISGLDCLTIHLLSQDNILKRSPDELGDIYGAVKEELIDTGLPELVEKGVRLRVIGRMEGIPDHIRNGFTELIERSKENSGLALTFVIGYDKDKEQKDAHEAAGNDAGDWSIVKKFLYLPRAGLPDVNAVIRTGEEERTSGILPYSIANAELLFEKDCFWPEYGPERFSESIDLLSGRRSKGGG